MRPLLALLLLAACSPSATPPPSGPDGVLACLGSFAGTPTGASSLNRRINAFTTLEDAIAACGAPVDQIASDAELAVVTASPSIDAGGTPLFARDAALAIRTMPRRALDGGPGVHIARHPVDLPRAAGAR